MFWRSVPDCSKVISKCKEWTDPKKFDPARLRGLLLGIIVNITIAEICMYKIIKQDVKGGELASHVPDFVLIFVSCFEGFAAPFLSWWGYRRRRLTLALWMVAATFTCCIWLTLPSPHVRAESEFCDAANYNNNISFVGVSSASIIRLVILVTTALVFVSARVAIWSHGIAYCEEYSPGTISIHYGQLLYVRAIILVLGNKFITSLVDTNLNLQIVILAVSFLPCIAQLPFVVPKRSTSPQVDGEDVPPPPDYDRGFLVTVARVCCNLLAMSQMFAMGLLTAALWGYGYYETDIIRAKFLLASAESESTSIVQTIEYFFVFFIVNFAGTKFSAPILKEYCKKKAIKQVLIMTISVVVFFLAITILPKCDKGEVIGLGDDFYGHPQCSFDCGCKPRWQELSPVCAVDTMVTFLSPCHAGCSASESINGINVYVNCTCSSGRVLVEACSNRSCKFAYDLHHALFLVLVTVFLLALQAQGVLIFKSVGRRDKSVAFGVASTMIAIVAFVCGPLIYLGIEVSSCRWYEGDRCHLYNASFSKNIGFSSAFIALMAALVCFVTYICIRIKKEQPVEEYKRNDQRHFEDTEL